MSSYLRASYYEIKDKDDFEKRVLASSKPVLVDFYAEYEFFIMLNPRLITIILHVY